MSARVSVEPGAIESIEEAMLLVRNAGLATVGLYYIGSLPFVLALLFFWTDMSADAFAHERIMPASFGVALLFMWMNVWQSIYTVELQKRVTGQEGTGWTARRILRTAMLQSAVQPTSLVLIPLGVLLLVPFAWIYGFYQNATVLGDGTDGSLRELITRSRAYASLWTRQSWTILSIQAGFALAVAVNIAILIVVVPMLGRMFLGVESTFTQSGASMLSSTFFAIVFAVTYLCVDPIMKAIYVLRCFYAESVQSGADLRVEFRRTIAGMAMVAALLAPIGIAQGQSTAPKTVSVEELDRVIDQVIHQRQYAWRLRRQPVPQSDAEKGFFVRLTESAVKTVRRWMRQLQLAFSRLQDWINEKLGRKRGPTADGGSAGSPATALRMWMYGLLALMAAGLAVLVIRSLRQPKPADAIAVADLVAAPIDLAAEDVSAEQLPEEGWRGMARDFLARQEFRLALRALYLASLAYLGQKELIFIHRSKSNWDYQRELGRRARSIPELTAVFGQNVAVFESGWYGRSEIGPESIDAFVANLDRMRACAE